MLLLAIRTVLLYFLTMLALKIMGKRQLGQLQPFEFVLILIISEMASLSLESSGTPISYSIVPILTLTILQISIALLNLKSERARKFICGVPSVVIKDGEILEDEMKDLRLNVNDLLEQMRAKGFFDLAEVEFAIMETNGQLSIMPRADKRPVQPSDIGIKPERETPAITLILDGNINYAQLNEANLSLDWLKERLARHNIYNLNQVFYASIDGNNNLFCQLKADDAGSAKPIREDNPYSNNGGENN